MKAIVCLKYGPPEVLQIREVEKPAPKDHEVLIKIFATTVHRGDVRIRGLRIPGPRWQQLLARLVLGIHKPSKAILGMELSGEIEATGNKVTRFKTGDAVFATTVWSGFGGYAEYKCMPEGGALALKPANLTFEEAAVIPAGGITALGIIKMARIQPGQQVLIYGASGSIGSFGVQLARFYGAQVTGVCSTANLGWVKSLGADRVIDYTHEDFTQIGQQYDVVFDAVDKIPPVKAKKPLKSTGIYLNVVSSSDAIHRKDAVALLHKLKELVEMGEVKAVIDRRYPMTQIVEAHRYVETGHKKGNVVVTIR